MKKQWKVIIALVVIMGAFFSFEKVDAATSSNVTLSGGELVEGRTLVPLRSIFEELGATVKWDQKTKKVTATKDKRKIVLTVGSKNTYVNGSHVVIDVPAQVKDGRTLVPLRFISESFGGSAKWDAANDKAIINIDRKNIVVQVERPGHLQVKIDKNKKGIYVNGVTLGATKQSVINKLGRGKRAFDDYSGYESLLYKVNSKYGKRNIKFSFGYDYGKAVDIIYFDIKRNFTNENWYKNLGTPFAKRYGVTYYYLESSEQLLMLKPDEGWGYVRHADNNFYIDFGMYDKVW